MTYVDGREIIMSRLQIIRYVHMHDRSTTYVHVHGKEISIDPVYVRTYIISLYAMYVCTYNCGLLIFFYHVHTYMRMYIYVRTYN